MSFDRNTVFLRPRFSLDVNKSKDEVLLLFKKEKKSASKRFLIAVVEEHVYIDILAKDNHFWSPHLHLEVHNVEGKSLVKGLFGPKPQVWTFFIFLHFLIGTFFIICGVWVYVGSTLESASVFPIVMLVVLPILWIVLYLFGRLGRDFGKNQTKKMQDFLIEILEIDS